VQPECPKCRSSMEEGFIKDESYGTTYPSQWVEGAPEKSFWTGLKTRGKDQVVVSTFRCVNCGYLESYAKG
jgi:predicted nucleic-acid-binding Zn-ribbon protein